jgi:hypothetical protein
MYAHQQIAFDQAAEGSHLQREVDIFLPSIKRQVLVELQFVVADILHPEGHIAAVETRHRFQNTRTFAGIASKDVEAPLDGQTRAGNVIGKELARHGDNIGFGLENLPELFQIVRIGQKIVVEKYDNIAIRRFRQDCVALRAETDRPAGRGVMLFHLAR